MAEFKAVGRRIWNIEGPCDFLPPKRAVEHHCVQRRVHRSTTITLGLDPEAIYRSFKILFLSACVAALCSSIARTEEPSERSAVSGNKYVLHIEPVISFDSFDSSSSFASGLGIGIDSSPTGVILPDTSNYFNPDSSDGELIYLTPRVSGLQLSWTRDLDTSSEPNGSKRTDSQTHEPRPTSIGANFTQGSDNFEFSLGADYGRTPKSVPGAMRLVKDEKLLRVGIHARVRAVILGVAFGNDVDPGNLGETLSWDVFGRYDLGSMAVGFVYNYTVESNKPSSSGNGIPGTLQGGLSYFFSPRLVVSANLAYGNYLDDSGSRDAGFAGLLGFSAKF